MEEGGHGSEGETDARDDDHCGLVVFNKERVTSVVCFKEIHHKSEVSKPPNQYDDVGRVAGSGPRRYSLLGRRVMSSAVVLFVVSLCMWVHGRVRVQPSPRRTSVVVWLALFAGL